MGDRHSHFLSLTGRKTGDKQAVMALGVLLEWNSWLVICVCVCVCWRFYIIALTCSGRRTELKFKKNEALPPNLNFRVWFDDVTGRKTGDRHSYFLNTGASV